MLDVALGGIVAALAVTCVVLYGKYVKLKAQMDSGQSKDGMSDRFRVLAEDSLKRQSEEFKASTAKPMAETMGNLLKTIGELKEQNTSNTATFQTRMEDMKETNDKLVRDTKTISGILSNSQKRGRFAEIGLERVFEMSGLVKDVNYYIQQTRDAGRPDFVVKLSEDRSVVIDSKAPLDSLWRAQDADNEAAKADALDKHAKDTRDHIQRLSKKEYSEGHGTLDYVVMVVPEYALLPALDRDSKLTEYALENKVVLVTPATLMVVLNAINLMWKQDEIAKTVRKIGELSIDLHSRLGKFASHYEKIGKGLNNAVSAYNMSVGSWSRMLMPAVERLEEAGAKSNNIPAIEAIDSTAREMPFEERQDAS